MTESIYVFVLDQLQASKGHWSEVAASTGLSKRTIEKIARREIENPGINKIERLATYFRTCARPAHVRKKATAFVSA